MKYSIFKLTAILCLTFSVSAVQAQRDTVSLNIYSGESEIKAKKSVTLTNGFHATGNVRIYISGVSFQASSPLTSLPSTNQNYVLTRVFKEPGVTAANINNAHTNYQENQVIAYFDGLGRPLQTVTVQGGLAGHDLVQPYGYDAYGRERVKYQPYSVWNNNGVYRSDALSTSSGQAAYYTSPPSGIKSTTAPFAVTVFEPSPLNRVTEQGAPGAPWQPIVNQTTGHTIKIVYGTNAAEVKLWTVSASGASTGGNYAAGTLTKTTTKDENWAAAAGLAGTTDEYKDLEGQVVLKRVWETNTKNLSTYYVYDDLGNLRYVLPPAVNEHTDRLTTALSSFSEGDTAFNDYIYGYHYDGRNRLVEKKIPGKGWEELVYNPLDQVVFTQDAVQKPLMERSYVKYDGLGRVIMTGVESNQADTRANLQNTVNALTVFWDVRSSATGNFQGYNNASAPSNLDNVKPQVINYYDDYNIPGLPYSFASSYSNKTKGLLTATKVKVLGSTGDFLWTVNYYADEGQVVKTYRQHYLSGSVNAANYDEISNTYNFSGELTASTRVHRTTGGSTTIANRYEYDHMGRQLATMQEINGQGETVLSKLDYNEIGQLKTKNQGGAAGSPFLQSTNFGYNERGWMTTSTSSLFSMQLSYQENSSGQYNGNISKQSWGAGTNTSSAGVYSYGYDKLNRLLSAVSTGVVMSEAITYDVMGNIHTLKRDAGGANLYHYNGNRLDHAEYFTDVYAYDANGNAIVDGRTHYNFQYNQLNLPSVVSNGINLSFVYDATGRKLRQTSTAGTVNYIDGIQYKPNGTIDFIQTGEGVARSNAGSSYSYEYNLADHLGNNRVTYYNNPSNNQVEVLQRDNYYAFGLRKVALAGNNKYLYNGKELQSELGLYDYGARFYDPVIGRWSVVDPLAEKAFNESSYIYGVNNPITMIDNDGRYAVSVHYKITYDALLALGYSKKQSDIIAHYSSTYADHPPAAASFADFMLHPFQTKTHLYRPGIDYGRTIESQEEKNSQWHAMMSDSEAEEGMTEQQAANRGRKFGWDNIFGSNGGRDLGKLGQGLHALQDATAHLGVKTNDHLGWNISSAGKFMNDLYGNTKEASGITRSATIVSQLLGGKNVNFKKNEQLNFQGMSSDQLTQIMKLLMNQGYQGTILMN
jgi:RHS repeat-associated protein